jgi:outer membrane receptor for ferric coprogen and ferric-rhodotorulic acid
MSIPRRSLQRSPLALQLSLLLVSMAALPVFGQEAATDTPRTDAKTLDTVSVFGTLDNTISAGGKDGQSLKETPKSVTVVTSERIDAQNLTDLKEALVQTTGVTVGAYSPVDSFFYSRGFRVQTLQFDGGAPAFTGGLGFFYTPDTAYLERIEMLRGVDGMYSGAGEPGGVINLVRKRPLDYLSTKLDLSLGSWDNRRAQIDITGPLGLDGRLRGRAVAAYVDKGYFWDRATNDKNIVYGVLEFDATDTTLLSIGANYETRKEGSYMGWSGVPRYADGSDLNLARGLNFAPDWARWDFTNREFFAKVEQKYGDTGKIRLNVSRITSEGEGKYLLIYGYVQPNANPLLYKRPTVYGSHNTYDSAQDLADLSASGKFGLFGRDDHSYTVGVDFSKLDGGGQRSYNMAGYAFGDGKQADVFNYDPSIYPETASTLAAFYPVNRQIQRGYYATVGLQLTDPLRLTLGGRYGEFNYKQLVHRYGDSPSTSYIRYSDNAFIPSAALSYKLSDRWTSYLSYGENYKVQATSLKAPLPGSPLDPITGNSLELGIKGEIFRGVNAAAAIYRVKRIGEGVRDPAYPENLPGGEGSSCCFIEQADITSEGIDLEFSGLVAPGWQLFSGYTYVRTKYNGLEGDGGFYGSGAFLLGVTPRQQLKVWSTYRLPGRLSRLTLNGGVIAQSEGFMRGSVLADPTNPAAGTIPFQYSQGGYALWNASVQFEVNDTWTVGVYGDNLTDKRYYQAIGDINRENVYGTPRSYNLTLKGRW